MHIVINGWFVGNTTAGSGQYIDHMLCHLPDSDSDTQLSLLLPRRVGADGSSTSYAGIQAQAIALPSLPHNLAKLYWEQVTVPRAARRLQADVLWVPYWAAPFWQPCATVVTVHDLIPRLLPAYRGGLLQRAYTALVSATARRSASVITVSDASALDVAVHLGIVPSRIHPVHHGPNQQDRPMPDAAGLSAIRRKYNLPPRYFLYLGGFDVRKNVQGVLSAYRAYLDRGGDPNVHLVIAGKLPAIDSDFAPDPLPMMDELGIAKQVRFCGWVSEADKAGLYALATAYLFPSHYEGFGMMVLEAMSAGTPVVTSSR